MVRTPKNPIIHTYTDEGQGLIKDGGPGRGFWGSIFKAFIENNMSLGAELENGENITLITGLDLLTEKLSVKWAPSSSELPFFGLRRAKSCYVLHFLGGTKGDNGPEALRPLTNSGE